MCIRMVLNLQDFEEPTARWTLAEGEQAFLVPSCGGLGGVYSYSQCARQPGSI